MAHTGLRRSEAAGLVWDALDLEDGTLASLGARTNTHPMVMQERLGHEDAGTLSGYTHLSPDLQQKAAHDIAKLIAGAQMVEKAE